MHGLLTKCVAKVNWITNENTLFGCNVYLFFIEKNVTFKESETKVKWIKMSCMRCLQLISTKRFWKRIYITSFITKRLENGTLNVCQILNSLQRNFKIPAAKSESSRMKIDRKFSRSKTKTLVLEARDKFIGCGPLNVKSSTSFQ